MVKRIVLFASGSGTNVENIIKYFKNNHQVKVINVFTNNPKAGVIERVRPFKIPVNVFDKVQLNSGVLCKQIKLLNPDLIVLAGFLLKIPLAFINTFTFKIVNIHPSLLPNHGGKGMYGDRVHQSVKDAGDPETGISIHYVNENYDEGSIIFQSKVEVGDQDSFEDIANRVHQLEYKHYPEVIQKILFTKHVG
tara:strand:- start:10111 stop:10689 length:579 start_codon:yes stop_codon:yes gene_type:complete